MCYLSSVSTVKIKSPALQALAAQVRSRKKVASAVLAGLAAAAAACHTEIELLVLMFRTNKKVNLCVDSIFSTFAQIRIILWCATYERYFWTVTAVN